MYPSTASVDTPALVNQVDYGQQVGNQHQRLKNVPSWIFSKWCNSIAHQYIYNTWAVGRLLQHITASEHNTSVLGWVIHTDKTCSPALTGSTLSPNPAHQSSRPPL
jgi:hypothetical protein